MIHEIKINKLFGVKGNDKHIKFNDNLTIIVGKNGSGKTTILNIINAIFTKSFYKLIEYDFESVEIKSDEGTVIIESNDNNLIVKRIDVENIIPSNIKLSKQAIKKIKNILINNKELIYEDIKDDNIKEYFYNFISNIYYNISKKEIYKNDSIRSRAINFSYEVMSIYFPTFRRIETEFLELVLKSVMYKPKTYIPSSSSIIEERISDMINSLDRTVIGLSNKDINSIIAKKWNEIVEIEKKRLNSLVEDFFFSLLEPHKNIRIGRNKLSDLVLEEDLVEIFSKTGLIGKSQKKWYESINEFVGNVNWAKSYKNKNITSFSEDILLEFEKMLRINFSLEIIKNMIIKYKETCANIDIYKEPFNDLVTNLKLFIDKEVEVKDGELIFNFGDNKLHFENLSAGEKQIVAIFVYTRLLLSSGSIVLIDEPELSLHISWQRKFLKALTSGDSNLQYIISTHSPFIISNFREYIVPLGPIGDN